MSDIPEARRLLKVVLSRADLQHPYYLGTTYGLIEEALKLLDRKKPSFVARRQVRPLSAFNIKYARHLRSQGMSLNSIATTLKSNIGRVSEACA